MIRKDSGQALIIIVLAMGLIVAMAGLAIDVGQWYAKRHQAQVAADAAALAAANCLATNDCTNTGNQPGDDAYDKAVDYAASNGVPASSVDISGKQVSVTTQSSVAVAFAGVFGVHATVSARAVASYTNNVNAPSSVYAADCASPTNPPTNNCTIDCSMPGVTISTAGHTSITGSIQTNGYVDISITGDDSIGPVVYGQQAGTGCGPNTVSVGGNASISNGPAAATQPFTAFPTTYNAVWTSSTANKCTASSTYTASTYTGYKNISVSGGTSTVPSTITLSKNNQTFGSAATPVVMCASTSITISGQKATLNDITLVAPSIVIQGNNFTITPDPNALADGGGSPAVALYDTSTTPLNFGSNDVNVTGAVYAPLAEIESTGNNGGSALIEGNTVLIDGNNSGDGPDTTLTEFGGGDQLTQ